MNGNNISEQYGAVDMTLDNLKFESKNKVWGLSSDGVFTFKEKQNNFVLDVPGLFFTMDNEAQFSDQTQLQANITGHEPSETSIGGANIVLNNAALATGIRSLQFTHHATLNLGRKLKGSPTTIGYNVFSNGNSAENMTSKGPIVGTLEETIDVTINGGNTNDVSTAVLTDVTYLKQGTSGTVAGCTNSNSLLAYNTYGGSVSDGWPDFFHLPVTGR